MKKNNNKEKEMKKWITLTKKAHDLMMKVARNESNPNEAYTVLNMACEEWGKDPSNRNDLIKVIGDNNGKPISVRFEFTQDEDKFLGVILLAEYGDEIYWHYLPEDDIEEEANYLLQSSCYGVNIINMLKTTRILSSDRWIGKIYKAKDNNNEDGIFHCFYQDAQFNDIMNEELGIKEKKEIQLSPEELEKFKEHFCIKIES